MYALIDFAVQSEQHRNTGQIRGTDLFMWKIQQRDEPTDEAHNKVVVVATLCTLGIVGANKSIINISSRVQFDASSALKKHNSSS